MPDPWESLAAELERWRAERRTARLWLRDDDAVVPTPALDRLIELTGRFAVPVLLAIVPAHATTALADRLAAEPHVLPCQHGFAHRNHAGAGEKAAELGPQRPADAVLADLRDGRRRALDLFEANLRPVLVPPWNRIAAEIVPRLPELGFSALSAFGWTSVGPVPGVDEVNCHVDIIDWKGTRATRPLEKLLADTVEALAAARASGAPVGILTHHLVHDEAAWAFLQALFSVTAGQPAVRWVAFDDLRADNTALSPSRATP